MPRSPTGINPHPVLGTLQCVTEDTAPRATVSGNPARAEWGIEVKCHNDDSDDRDNGGKMSDARARRWRAAIF